MSNGSTLPAEAAPATTPAQAPNKEDENTNAQKFKILKPVPIGEYRLFRQFKGMNGHFWHPNNREGHADNVNNEEVKSDLTADVVEGQYYVSDEMAMRFLRKDEFDLEKTKKSLEYHLYEWLPKYKPEKMRLGGEKNQQLRAMNAEGYFRYLGRDRTTGWCVMAGDGRALGPYTKNASADDWLLYYIYLAAQLEKIFKKDEAEDVETLRSISGEDLDTIISDITAENYTEGNLIDISNVPEKKIKSLLLKETIDEKRSQHDFYYAQKTYVKNIKQANSEKEIESKNLFKGHINGNGADFKSEKLASGVLMAERRCTWILNCMNFGMGILKRPSIVTKMSDVLSDYFPDSMQYFVMMNLTMGKMVWGMIKSIIPAKAQLRANLNATAKDGADAKWLSDIIPPEVNVNCEINGWNGSSSSAHWAGIKSPNFSLELGEKQCPNVAITHRPKEEKQ